MTELLIAILTSLFFPGIIIRVKSIAGGRKGPGIFQPWKNIRVLLRKSSVISTTTSYIFALGPVVYLSTILCALLIVPFPGQPALLHFRGDFIFLVYLLALGKFMLIIGALDTGSSFEGMGANREALYSMLAEPVIFILFGTLVMLTGYTSMDEIFTHFHFTTNILFIIGIIAVYLLVQVAMIENSRMPIDDPKTHLELTMIHEVMILDHSGFDLALIHIATAFKFAVFGGLIANFLIPGTLGLLVSILIYMCIQMLFAVIIGLLESFRARKKLVKNPQFIVTLSSIALIAFILVLLLIQNMIR
jgi:formate hydrogenlyase subunit 4